RGGAAPTTPRANIAAWGSGYSSPAPCWNGPAPRSTSPTGSFPIMAPLFSSFGRASASRRAKSLHNQPVKAGADCCPLDPARPWQHGLAAPYDQGPTQRKPNRDRHRRTERSSRPLALDRRGRQAFPGAPLAGDGNPRLRGDLLRQRFRRHRPDRPLGDGNGLDVVSALKRKRPDARAIVLTGYGNIATAVTAVKLGAVDYLSKPA